MKTCTKCFVEKSDDLFYIQKNKGSEVGRLASACKACTCKSRKVFREENVELIRDSKREYHALNRDARNKHKRERRQFLRQTDPSEITKRDKARWLKSKYGITLEHYEALRKKQKDACEICRKPFIAGGRKTNFGVDHSHKTGAVRGLLCYHCNAGLGMARESVKILNGMIAYLHRYNEEK